MQPRSLTSRPHAIRGVMNRIGRDLFATCAVLLLVGAAEARLSGGGETLQPEKGPESQPMPSAPSRVASVPLRSLSARSHLLVGARANAYLLSDDDEPQYRALAVREFNSLCPEFELSWEHVHPQKGNFDFLEADYMAEFARASGARLRGPGLVSLRGMPDWFCERKDDVGDCAASKLPDKEELRKVVHLHIRRILSRFATQDALRVNEPRGSPPDGDALAAGEAASDLVASRGVRAASRGLEDAESDPLAQSMVDGTVAAWDVVEYPLAHTGGELAQGWWTELGPDWMVEAFREASRHTGGKLMIAEHGVGLPGPRTNALVALVKSLMRKGAKVDGVALRLRLRVREDPGMLLRALREDRASGPEPATPPYSPSPHGKEYMATQRGPGAVVFDWEAWRATVRQQLTRVGDMEQRQAHALAEEMEAAVHNATAEGSDPGAALADALSDLILPALGVGRGGGEAGNLTVDSLLPLTDPQGGDPAADGSGSGSSSGAGAGAVGEATRRALALQLSRILGQAVYHFEADIPAPTGAAAAAAAMSQATGMRGGVADTAVGTEAADEAAARAESASEEQQLEGIVADEMRRESEAAAEDGAEGAEGGEGEGSEGEGGGSGSGNEPTFEPLFDYGALWDRSPHSGPEHRDHSPGGLSTFSRFMRPPVPRPSTDAAAAPGGDAGGAPPAAVVDQAEEGEGSDEALTPSDLGLPRLGGAESGGDGAFSLPGVLLEVAASVRDGAGALPAFPPPATTARAAPRVYGREALGMDNFTAMDVAEGEDQPADLSQPFGVGDYPEEALRRRATRVLNTALNAQYSGRATVRRDPRGDRSEEHLYMDVTRALVPGLRATVERFAALGVEVHFTDLDLMTAELPPGTRERDTLLLQAELTKQIVGLCAGADACTHVGFADISDRFTWAGPPTYRLTDKPSLYDARYRPKPSREAAEQALRGD